MSTNFPGSLDSYTTKVDNSTDVLASHMNDPQDAIEALEAKVGVTGSAVATSHDYLLTNLPTQEQNFDIGAYQMRALTFYSDQATGTAPFTVLSTTNVANLNASSLSGWAWVSGDLMLSTNTSAPTGWTDVSGTYNDKFIRISSGTPLTTGGSNTHDHGTVTGSHVLTIAEMPAHTHVALQLGINPALAGGAGQKSGQGVTGSAGSGDGHTHSVASDDNVPAYIELRIFQKN